MAILFDPPIVAGTTLVREAIASQNFETGTAGWSIDADGNAEFNDGTFRGTVTAAMIVGSQFASSLTDPSIWINEDDENTVRAYNAAGDKVAEFGVRPSSSAGLALYSDTDPYSTETGGDGLHFFQGSPILSPFADFVQTPSGILLNTQLAGGVAFDTAKGRWVWVLPGSTTLETRHTPGAGPGGSGNYTAFWSGSTAYNGSTNWDALTYERKATGYGSLVGCFTSATGAGNTVMMLPIGYRPTRQVPVWVERNNGGVNTGFMAQVTPAGNFNLPAQTGGGTANGNQFLINAEYPLY